MTTSASDGSKKLHTITAEGKAYLEACRPAVNALLARMEEANRTDDGGPAPHDCACYGKSPPDDAQAMCRGPLTEAQINAVLLPLMPPPSRTEQT